MDDVEHGRSLTVLFLSDRTWAQPSISSEPLLLSGWFTPQCTLSEFAISLLTQTQGSPKRTILKPIQKRDKLKFKISMRNLKKKF